MMTMHRSWFRSIVVAAMVALPAPVALSVPVALLAPGAMVRAQEPAVGTSAAKPVVVRPQPSEAGRAALATARDLARATRTGSGPERSLAIELAAKAYDEVATQFAAEPVVAGLATYTAAGLWRQHKSLALAERGYLRAAEVDPDRFGQRGLFEAAEMQRRQQRAEDAMRTYERAEAVDPRTARAQEARLWRVRLHLSGERLDEALAVAQAALECADSPAQTIETANVLALVWIEKGDFVAAQCAIDHAGECVAALEPEDADQATIERLQRAVAAMSARKALAKARDVQQGAAKDAVQLDEAMRPRG
jgi:tetratricopeptide (TPR) repeat protein